MSHQNTAPGAAASLTGAPSTQSQWPTVIGVLTVCFGAIGAAIATWSTVSLVIGGAPGSPEGFVPPAPVMVYSVIDVAIAALLSLMLIVGGIGTMRRRASGVRLLRIYAITRLALAIPLLAGGLWVVNTVTPAMVEAIAAQSKAKSGEQGTESSGTSAPTNRKSSADKTAEVLLAAKPLMSGITSMGVCCNGMLGLVLPIVLLTLLSSPARKAEIASWTVASDPDRVLG